MLIEHIPLLHQVRLEVTSIGAFGNNIEFLVVAGGGGGGGSRDNYAGQGGGGAGGLITNVPGVATPGPSQNPNVPLTRSSVFDVDQVEPIQLLLVLVE